MQYSNETNRLLRSMAHCNSGIDRLYSLMMLSEIFTRINTLKIQMILIAIMYISPIEVKPTLNIAEQKNLSITFLLLSTPYFR